MWHYQGQKQNLPSNLDTLNFSEFCQSGGLQGKAPMKLEGQCEAAQRELLCENRIGQLSHMQLSEEGERLRWFVLPQEAARDLGIATAQHAE